MDTGPGKHHSGILSPAYQPQDPAQPPTHQPTGTSAGAYQAKQLTGCRNSLTHQQTGCLRLPKPTATPRHSQAHQRTQDPVSHNSAQTINLGPPRDLQKETPGPSSNHQKAGSRPSILWALAPSSSRPTQGLGHPRLHSQGCQEAALLTSHLIPALGPLGSAARTQDPALPYRRPALVQRPGFTHQWAGNSPGLS